MQEASRNNPIPNNPRTLAPNATSEVFYKVQITAWTKLNPIDAELIEIAKAADAGDAVVTSIEVARTASAVAEIDDPDVREQFHNMAAAERLIHNAESLPPAIREQLRSALGKLEARAAA
jgi:hypothetical protein